MKSVIKLFLLYTLCLSSCRWKTIKGDGVIVSKNRPISKAENLVFKGDFDVVLQPGELTALTIETDRNLQPFVLVTETPGSLVFTTKKKDALNRNMALESS